MTQQILADEHVSSLQSSEISKEASQLVDPDSRIELLERNLQYIQQQHETTLIDLHNEINRLQQENRDLHYQLTNTHLLSSSEQEEKTTDKSLNDDHLHLEKKFDELEKQLIESEEKNIYLIQKIDELNKISSSKSEESSTNNLNIDNNHQHLLTPSSEKRQQYLQEIAKLRSVLVEILNTERLSIASKILLRDCLTSTNISELSMSKTTTTPIDMLFFNEKQQQRFNSSPSTTGKNLSFRQLNDQHRPMKRRANLRSVVIQGNNSSLFQHSTDVNDSLPYSLTPNNYSQHQSLMKTGETSIARRERHTQELQKNRLLKTLYH